VEKFYGMRSFRRKKKIWRETLKKEDRMGKTSCREREESTARGAHHICVPSKTSYRHRLSAYATERRPMAWAKAAGMPNR
jgi:hypothetical protein